MEAGYEKPNTNKHSLDEKFRGLANVHNIVIEISK